MKGELRALIDRLNPVCRRAFETAAEMCVHQTHYNVEIEHLLRALLDLPETDFHAILRYYEVEEAHLQRELTHALDDFKRGNARTPALAPTLPRLIEAAWSIASLRLGASEVRSGALLMAILEDPAVRGQVRESAPSLIAIPRDDLAENLAELLKATPEGAGGGGRRGASGGVTAGASPELAGAGADARTDSALDRFTVDMTEEARQGRIDEIRGRDDEIRQVLDILMRRRQNNPILTGEAGVGKTAVVEGFAMRIAEGSVPAPLRSASVRALDLGLLQAGAGVKGEFEHRLKTVIDEVKASATPIILFIDEAHTIIGAGGPEGQGDAANLLKPVLARGELRTIAATTWSEYKKYVEKDPALARRFQVVRVEEPSVDAAIEMLRGVARHLEEHHGVQIRDGAIRAAVELSDRYMSGRRLPDKAVGLLDTACARVALARSAPPPQVEAAARSETALGLEIEALKREMLQGSEHGDRLAELQRRKSRVAAELEEITERWKKEEDLAEEIRKFHDAAREAAAVGLSRDDVPEILRKLAPLEAELEQLQGDAPLVPVMVDEDLVAGVISEWTGIPVGKMVRNEIRAVLALQQRLQERVIGQDQALDIICRRMGTSGAGLEDPSKPTGVFLLVGPSGVGKSETGVALAESLYGGERNLITVNMSEYQEAHTVSSLKGAPPGYVGYGTGGVLTEAVRRRPYSVVLLDEVEKAHADVLEVFYQVFDKGVMEDGEGNLIDFKNTTILLTSNHTAEVIVELCARGATDAESLAEAIRPHLLRRFPAAFLGRLTIVPYLPLGEDDIQEVVTLKMAQIQQRIWEQHRADLTYAPEVVETIAARCTEVDSGARNIDHIIAHAVLPEISVRILEAMADGMGFSSIHMYVAPDGGFAYNLEEEVL